jgi:hypothetical protein
LFIVAVVLASKFIEDSDDVTRSIHSFISPLYSARELNDMERSFLGKEYIIPLTLFDFLKLTLSFYSSLLHIAIVKVNASYTSFLISFTFTNPPKIVQIVCESG